MTFCSDHYPCVHSVNTEAIVLVNAIYYNDPVKIAASPAEHLIRLLTHSAKHVGYGIYHRFDDFRGDYHDELFWETFDTKAGLNIRAHCIGNASDYTHPATFWLTRPFRMGDLAVNMEHRIYGNTYLTKFSLIILPSQSLDVFQSPLNLSPTYECSSYRLYEDRPVLGQQSEHYLLTCNPSLWLTESDNAPRLTYVVDHKLCDKVASRIDSHGTVSTLVPTIDRWLNSESKDLTLVDKSASLLVVLLLLVRTKQFVFSMVSSAMRKCLLYLAHDQTLPFFRFVELLRICSRFYISIVSCLFCTFCALFAHAYFKDLVDYVCPQKTWYAPYLVYFFDQGRCVSYLEFFHNFICRYLWTLDWIFWGVVIGFWIGCIGQILEELVLQFGYDFSLMQTDLVHAIRSTFNSGVVVACDFVKWGTKLYYESSGHYDQIRTASITGVFLPKTDELSGYQIVGPVFNQCYPITTEPDLIESVNKRLATLDEDLNLDFERLWTSAYHLFDSLCLQTPFSYLREPILYTQLRLFAIESWLAKYNDNLARYYRTLCLTVHSTVLCSYHYMRKLFAKWEKRCPFGPITPVVSAACRVVSACFSPVLLALQAPYYYLYTESLHKAFAPIIDGVPNSICWGSGISALSIGEWLHAWVDIFVDHVYFYELDYTALIQLLISMLSKQKIALCNGCRCRLM
jgi:hypothetical protein